MELPDEVRKIFDKFKTASFQLFLVGGSVRDLLMDKKVNDWDFTTDAKPEEILKLFPTGHYNNKFGTVGIPTRHLPGEQRRHLEGELIEITTMRKEGDYRDHRHPTEIGWTDKIEEDLARRDFTVNALAMDSKTEITDPFGGQIDLNEKIIKTVGNPNDRFKEDALRLMRAVRIASEFQFEIEPETYEAIKQNSQLINDIAWERIKDELLKILASKGAYNGLLKLKETELLKIILPEIQKCFGIVQEGPNHDRIYDIGDHSFRTMRETPSTDPVVRFAALLHDVGKGETFKKDKEGNVTFYNHELTGANISLKICRKFNLSKVQTDKIYKLIRWHMFSTNENQTDSAIRRFIKNVGLENIDDIMALRIGDRLGGDTRKPVSWRLEKYQQRIKQVLKKPFSISDLKVSGTDVMKILNIPPGPRVGEVLSKLFEEVLKDSTKNNREYLIDKIRQLAYP